jgi:hypothetical protein
MAKKKGSMPTKACPQCGKPIHARSKSHEACGWKDEAKKAVAAVANGRKKGNGRRGRKPKKEAFPFGANAGDTQKQFQRILALTEEISPAKIRKLLDLAEQLQKI